MKKLLIITAMMASAVAASAQKAETIETCAANQRSTEWYEQQVKAWQKIVDEEPSSQWAWRNLFRATFYVDMFNNRFANPDDTTTSTHRVMREMERRVPDSFVTHLSRLRYDPDNKPADHIVRAIELLPETVVAEDLSYLAARSWLYPQCVSPEKRNELFTKAYRRGAIPERIMHYNWNMLSATEKGALYFGNGDNVLIPGKMMQEAIGWRTDITIIPLWHLCEKGFRHDLFTKLGIKPFNVSDDFREYRDKYDAEWQKHFYADIIMHIITQTRRPAYFFPDIISHVALNADNLYNEGLLLKYSDVKYDNFGVAMRNVEEVYHLEYLTEPDLVYSSWSTSSMLEANYVTMLAGIVRKFSEGGKLHQAAKLFRILCSCLDRCALDADHKQWFVKELCDKSGASIKEVEEAMSR
ncbi:MAG: hypothetical protein IKR18_04580 [Bacteroidaceae bacterium]|nr:hypothetical protein [Bacteroidaceae bacterium]